MFTSCEVTLYKLNIYDANFMNYHHMVKSNFKGINLRVTKLITKTKRTQYKIIENARRPISKEVYLYY